MHRTIVINDEGAEYPQSPPHPTSSAQQQSKQHHSKRQQQQQQQKQQYYQVHNSPGPSHYWKSKKYPSPASSISISINMETTSTAEKPKSRLFHESLELLPLPVRFAMSGVVGNLFFMSVYNVTYQALKANFSASTVFAVVQFGCIIVNHFLNIGIVFGWPAKYLPSLMSNMPVGLASLLMGSLLAGYLEKIAFDAWITGAEIAEEAPSFPTSIAIMAATGAFNFVALNVVNKPSEGHKKEQ